MKIHFHCLVVLSLLAFQLVLSANVAGQDASRSIKPQATVTPKVQSYKARYDTIAHKILKLESEAATVNDEMYRLVDAILDDAKARIQIKPVPDDRDERRLYARNVLTAIDDILIRRNFIYPRDRKEDWTLLLSDGLTPQKLDAVTLDELMRQRHNIRRQDRINRNNPFYLVDCDTASYLYLAVGEVLGLPLSMVDLPEHNFIRWLFDAYAYVNWETMYGVFRSNSDYRLFLGDDDLAEELYNRKVYLVAMSPQDVIGYSYGARALKWEKSKNYKRAIADYRTSIEMYPRPPFSYNNLAWQYATCPDAQYRNAKGAIELAQKAISIFPAHANFVDTLAAAYAENGEFEKAVVTERQAFSLEPKEEYRELIAVYGQRKTYAQYQQEKENLNK